MDGRCPVMELMKRQAGWKILFERLPIQRLSSGLSPFQPPRSTEDLGLTPLFPFSHHRRQFPGRHASFLSSALIFTGFVRRRHRDYSFWLPLSRMPASLARQAHVATP